MTKFDPATKLRLACEAALNEYIEAGKSIVQETISGDRGRRNPGNERATGPREPSPRTRPVRVQRPKRRRPEKEERKALLLAALAEHPGEPLIRLSAVIGQPVSKLRTAMAELVDDGQVSRIGERSFTRYFPVSKSYAAETTVSANREGAGLPANQASIHPPR